MINQYPSKTSKMANAGSIGGEMQLIGYFGSGPQIQILCCFLRVGLFYVHEPLFVTHSLCDLVKLISACNGDPPPSWLKSVVHAACECACLAGITPSAP